MLERSFPKLLILILHLPYNYSVYHCLTCSSNQGSNMDCEEGRIEEVASSGNCTSMLGDSHCYVVLIRDKMTDEMVWNSEIMFCDRYPY